VVTAGVDSDATGQSVRAIGTLAAAKEVELVAQVSGLVSEIDFKPGSKVSEGDVLVRLDDADQQVAVERAQIALDSANAARDRARTLAKTNNVTAVALADAENAARQAEVDLRAAQLELDKRTVKAPFSGIIGLTDLSVGDLLTTSKVIAVLDDTSTLTATFNVVERAAGLVKVGQDVQAVSLAAPGVTFRGKVTAVDSRLDETARTLKVKASLPNETDLLKPGMAVTVSMDFPGEARPAVPSLAIQWDRDGSYVWKLDGGAVHRTAVQIITRRNGTVTVAGSLAPSDRVVVEGLQRMRDGLKVMVAGEDGDDTVAALPAPNG
jgi:RND family efflux transporter MFP subunit